MRLAQEGALGFPTPNVGKLMADLLFQNALIFVCLPAASLGEKAGTTHLHGGNLS